MPDPKPNWKLEIERRLAQSQIDPASQPGLADEFAQHLEDRYADLLAAGNDEGSARQSAMNELDNLHGLAKKLPPAKREQRSGVIAGAEALPVNFWADILRDLRYGLRGMRKSPVFTLIATLTLGLGIGANTTVFTVINSLVLRPLPVDNAARLVAFYDTLGRGSTQAAARLPLSYANFQDYAQQQTVFSGIAGYTPVSVMTLRENSGLHRAFGQFVTSRYFETLGLKPALGRFFLREEDSAPGSAPVAVLSYNAWKGHFGGVSNIIGRTLELNRVAFTVVGVAPPGFLGITAVFGPDVWLPATMCERAMTGSRDVLSDRSKPLLHGVARLKTGVSIEQAQIALQGTARMLEREYPDANQGHSILVRSITDELFSSVGGENGIIFGSTVLFVIVGLVLAIACSNVANLLLARSAARRQELAVRLSIGASRSRLVRQMLTESVLLSLLGFGAGLLIGVGGCRLVWSFVPPDVVQNMLTPKLDRQVFLFSLLVSVATAFLFGLVPALRASRTDVVSTLKEEARTTGRGKRSVTFANALLAAQVAFSLLCLITSALCFRSIQRAYTIDPGFQTGHLALFMTNPAQAGYDEPRAKDFYRAIRERVTALPGVVSASWASGLPFWNTPARSLAIEGVAPRAKTPLTPPVVLTVGTGYFDTMSIPLISGRAFSEADGEKGLPVGVINEKLARTDWPRRSALGQRFQLAGDKTWRTVVGVVKNANYSTLGEAVQPAIYLPARQNFSGGMTLYVKTKAEPSGVFSAVQNAIRDYDPNAVVSDSTGLTGARTGVKLIQQVLFGPRVGVTLLAVFGSLALLLASIGLYGVLAFSVNGRRKEIGVRMALGATPSNVLRQVLREGMMVVGCGVVAGLGMCLLAGRVLSRVLFGISSLDPISLGMASGVLLTVALIACYFPARLATQVDPMLALRDS